MKVTVDDILAKIPGLPPDYVAHVHLGEIVAGVMVATVDSFTAHLAPRDYTASIKRGQKDGELEVSCVCPARVLCSHLVAFYAVAKKDDPAVIEAVGKIGETAEPVPDDHRRGLQLIAQAQEKWAQAQETWVDATQDYADGLRLIVKEGVES